MEILSALLDKCRYMTDKCPFCREEIEASNTCPRCGRTIVELTRPIKTQLVRSESAYPQTPSPAWARNRTNAVAIRKILRDAWEFFLDAPIIAIILVAIVIIPVTMLFRERAAPISTLTGSAGSSATGTVDLFHRVPISLDNGTVLFQSDGFLFDLGELEIKNGTPDDAVVKLVDVKSNSSAMTVYVKTRDEYVIRGIPDGVYAVSFGIGEDWNAEKKAFMKRYSCSRFDDSLSFLTVGGKYTKYQLTLNAVTGGKATTSPVDPVVFGAY